MLKTLQKNKFIILAFLLLTIIFYFIPYAHDEWMWGSQEGLDLLKNGFQGYNGRYFGNIFALIITRSVLIKSLFMSGTILLLLTVLTKFTNLSLDRKTTANKKFLLIFGLALLILIPTKLFQQTYGWPAAFVNFVPPVISLVVFFIIVNYLFTNETANLKHPVLTGIVLSLGTQFFSENISVYITFLAIALCIYSWKTRKMIDSFLLAFLVTSFLSLIIMLINPAYLNAANNTDGYKKINLSLSYFYYKTIGPMAENIFHQNRFINLCIATLTLLISKKQDKDILQSKATQLINKGALFFISTYTVFSVFIYPYFTISYNRSQDFTALLALLYYLSIFIFILIQFKGNLKAKLLFLFLSIVCTAGPLFIAEPIGPRSFYITYVFWIILILQFIAYYFNLQSEKENNHEILFITKILKQGILVLLIFYTLMFAYTYRVEQQRKEIIDEAIANKETSVKLPLLPNGEYFWEKGTTEENWMRRYKTFYNIPQDITITFVPMETK